MDPLLVQPPRLALDARQGLGPVAFRQALRKGPQPSCLPAPGGIRPPEIRVSRQPAQDVRQSPDTVPGQAERGQPILQPIPSPAYRLVDLLLPRHDPVWVRRSEGLRTVLDRRHRRVAADVVDHAFHVRGGRRRAGAVVPDRDGSGDHPLAEIALLEQRPDHVGAPGGPPVHDRREVRRQPQRLGVEHEGVAAAARPVDAGRCRPDSACKRPEHRFAREDALRRAGQTAEGIADPFARKCRCDPEGRFQPVGLAARQVVVPVPPARPLRGVFRAPVRQHLLRVERREPVQGSNQIDQLDPDPPPRRAAAARPYRSRPRCRQRLPHASGAASAAPARPPAAADRACRPRRRITGPAACRRPGSTPPLPAARA